MDWGKQLKKKNKLFLKYRKTNSVQNETNDKIYRNKLNHLLKISEKKHFQELLNSSKDNIKKTWQIMKNIVNKGKSKQIQSKFKLSDGTITTNKDVISSKFNDCFCEHWAYFSQENSKSNSISFALYG